MVSLKEKICPCSDISMKCTIECPNINFNKVKQFITINVGVLQICIRLDNL